jgi:hypothetical protein
MNNHPAYGGEPFDGDPDEALVRRVAARQSEWLSAKRGEPVPVPTNNDPRVVRRMLVDDRDAAMIALWALLADLEHTPDAVDAALADTTPAAAANMPHAVASAILHRVDDRHAPAVWRAVDVVLQRFERTDGSAALAELCVHRIADTVRAAITDSIAAELAGAVDHNGHPVTDDQIAEAAAGAAKVVVDTIIARLRTDLLALAGL